MFYCESKYLNKTTFTFFFFFHEVRMRSFCGLSDSWFWPYVNAHIMWCAFLFSSNIMFTSKSSTLFHIFKRSFTQICYEYIVWWIDNISGEYVMKKIQNSAKNFALCKFKKGYILREPDLSPIARSFWTGSYASAVGECGNPCRNVCNERREEKINIEIVQCFYSVLLV